MTVKHKRAGMFLLPILICMVSIISLSMFWFHEYRQTTFVHMSKLCEILITDHPDIEAQVLSSLKDYHTYSEQEITGNEFLTQYGYHQYEFLNTIPSPFLLSVSAILLSACGFLLSQRYLKRHNQMKIDALTRYLEQVNLGAQGTIIQQEEDDFSHLQDEIYKTVTSLSHTKEAAIMAKTNFADNLANIAHQLKTPITAAFLSLQLMKKTTSTPYAKQIEMQLERLNHLEESLLTLSKIDAGVLHLTCAQVDIYTALSLAAENLQGLLKGKDISVWIPDKGCAEIRGDMEWMMEAFMNLMKNCMEHSPYGGTIHCDYSSNPLYAEILIWDEGQGFDAEDIPHLFERFYQGRRAAKNGIGIGLSLARAIFALQNGHITARNLPTGGACFEIRMYSH